MVALCISRKLRARSKQGFDRRSRYANKRPISFTSEDGQSIITCGYDYMGRRYMKKVTISGAIESNHHYLYRGYLQIAALDLTLAGAPALWYTHWDPTEPVATRPLSIRKNGTWYTFGHDLTKNVTELYDTTGTIVSTYDYTPFGAVAATGIDQVFQWSSEVYDAELGMVYYNYRHYNPMDGRWIGRDPIAEQGGWNLYQYTMGSPIQYFDRLGGFPVSSLVESAINSAVTAGKKIINDVADVAKSTGTTIMNSGAKGRVDNWTSKARSKGQWKEQYRVSRKVGKYFKLVGGFYYTISSDGCCVTATGGGFIQGEVKTAKLGFGGSLVGRLNISDEAKFKYCLNNESNQELEGNFKISVSAGFQVGLDVYAVEGAVEIGGGVSWLYSYKSESWNDPSLSLYVRAFYDINLGIWQKRKEIKYTIGGDVDTF